MSGKAIKRIFYFINVLLLIAVTWASYFLLYGNFHKVDKDVYRSAQLFSFNLPYYIEKHEIKSILNLSGGEGKSFYKDEIDISKKYNIVHYDYQISDREVQNIQSMNEIIDIIKNAPKPILIHCKAGADRTSLVSSLYLYTVKKDLNASNEFSLLYGHFPWLGSKTKAMDESFSNYVNKKPILQVFSNEN